MTLIQKNRYQLRNVTVKRHYKSSHTSAKVGKISEDDIINNKIPGNILTRTIKSKAGELIISMTDKECRNMIYASPCKDKSTNTSTEQLSANHAKHNGGKKH